MTTTPTTTLKASLAEPILASLAKAAPVAAKSERQPEIKGLKMAVDLDALDRMHEEPERWDGMA